MGSTPSTDSRWPMIQARLSSTISQLSQPFNDLPPELVHHILDMAATRSRHACLNICLVSSWARRIAQPHLCRAVVIPNISKLFQFCDHFIEGYDESETAKYPLIPGSLVDGLWLQSCYWPKLRFIFDACDNVTHLTSEGDAIGALIYLFGFVQNTTKHNHDLHWTALDAEGMRLILDVQFDPTCIPPIFKWITHMHIIAIGSYMNATCLDVFSHLTHLSLPYCCEYHLAKAGHNYEYNLLYSDYI